MNGDGLDVKGKIIRDVQNKIDTILSSNNKKPKILEAGCGSLSQFEFKDAYLVGLDISQKQLDRASHLSEKMCADLENVDLSGRNFDVIICFNVLEHLARPQKALRNLLVGLAPNGLLVLAGPNPCSLIGFITKFTPFAVHKFYSRRVLGHTSAGKNDSGPFRTFMRFAASPKNIVRFAESNGMRMIYLQMYRGEYRVLQEKYRLAKFAFDMLDRISPKLMQNAFVVMLQKHKNPCL